MHWRLAKSEEIPVSEYQFSLVLENIGEVNISEFKVRIDFSPENAIRLDSYSRAVKDGWLESSHLFGPSRQEQTPMRVNIYSQDTFLIRTHDFRLPSTDSLAENDLIVRWTLYLSNTLPITGQVSIASEFERHNVR